MKKTTTLIFRTRNLGMSVKVLLTFLILNFVVQNTSAQININGLSTEWDNYCANRVGDPHGNGVVDDQFTEGSKDFLLAVDWRWAISQTKAKNDIANGAAVIVNNISVNGANQSGGPFLAFAGDRTSNNGDAQIGFWFFQSGTHPNIEGDGTQNFIPPKTVGDILVLADFTGGGRDAAVTVLKWVGTGGTFPNSNGAFNQIALGAAVAQNNGGPVAVPGCWVFNVDTQYETNEFYEGFVDLGQFGPGAACFSRFMLETRSSQSITASLDDFVGGPLGGAPNCSITGNQTICSGSSTCFSASGGAGSFTYSWTGPGGFTASGAQICNLTAAGTYNVTVSNASGCTSSCGRELFVNQTPSCSISPNNLTICSYQTGSFTASGGNSYSWSGPGGFTANTAVISGLTAQGTYSVTVTGAGGCTSSCSKTLTVVQPPSCSISPDNQTICSYQTASFTASGGNSYSWSGPGGFTANTAVISNLTTTGTYTVVVTGAAGCTSSCSKTLTVVQPPSCSISPNNLTICSYQTGSFTASGGNSYSWSGPGGFTANTAVISNLTAQGTYSVVVTGASGCTSTCSKTLTVVQPPSCSISPDNQTICSGSTASFTASGGNSYSWTGPGGFTANTAVISNLATTGTYTVVVTGAAGCTSSCSKTLTVVENPVCGILPNNLTICSYQTGSFTASGGSSYAWSGPGGFTANTAVISNLTAAGTYSVTVTAGAGCTSSCSKTLTKLDPPNCSILPNNLTICSYQTGSFTASGGNSYSWSGPNGFTANSAIISNLTAAGTYSVTVTGTGGCTSSCSKTLTKLDPPNCSILPNNLTICEGSTGSFTASGGNSYSWAGPGGFTANTAVISNLTAAGTYSVTVTGTGSCTSSCSKTLAFVPNASANAGADPASQCRAASVDNGSLVFGVNTFSVTGTVQNGTPTWSVFADGGYSVTIVSPNSLTTDVKVGGNVNGGTVTLLLTATSNTTPKCADATDKVDLKLDPRPLVKEVIGSEFCANVTTTGSVTLKNSQNGVSYQLMDDVTPVQDPKTGNGGDLIWYDLPDGDYTVIGTFLATGCNSTSGPASVDEHPATEPTIDPVDELCSNADCVTLVGHPAGGTFSGTGVSNGQFCPAVAGTGTHTITYTYENEFGCTASSTIDIDVIGCEKALCTYTQGYFGNDGGKSCDGTNGGLTTAELIEQSLSNWGGTLTLGANGTCGGVAFDRRLTITNTPAQIACIIDKLPGGGPAKELSKADDICSFNDLKNGRINNVLLAQTLALGLNIGIGDPQQALGDFELKAGCLYTAKAKECGSEEYDARVCEHWEGDILVPTVNDYENRCFSEALINVLDQYYTKDVSGLFALANDALGNADCVAGTEHGLSLSEIAGAAGSINEVFDECRIAVGWDIPCPPAEQSITPRRITADANAEGTAVAGLKISAFPNPFRDQVRFVIESPVAGQAVLEVYNVAGQRLQTLYNGRIEANETKIVNYKPKFGTNSMMIYRLRIGNQTVSGKLIGIQ